MRFSRQDRGLGDLERALKAERPEIDRSVQQDIVAGISAHPVRRSGFRLVFAGILTATVFGAMAAFGGVSYATNSVQHSVGYNNDTKGWNYTPSCDQYGNGGSGGYGDGGGNDYWPSFGDKGSYGGFGFGGFGFGGFGW